MRKEEGTIYTKNKAQEGKKNFYQEREAVRKKEREKERKRVSGRKCRANQVVTLFSFGWVLIAAAVLAPDQLILPLRLIRSQTTNRLFPFIDSNARVLCQCHCVCLLTQADTLTTRTATWAHQQQPKCNSHEHCRQCIYY